MIMLLLDIFAWLFVIYIGIVFLVALFETVCEIDNELFELGFNISNALNNLIKVIFKPESYEFLTLKNLDSFVRCLCSCSWLFFRQIFNNFTWKRLS
jgi:hypothetical protein